MPSIFFGSVLLALMMIPLTATGAHAVTLDDVKARGTLTCGTAPSIPGFAYTDEKGARRGFDVDFCRALAAAILGDAEKFQAVPLGPRDAFPALATRTVDVLTHRFTWTYNRDNGAGIEFLLASFYDGQGFVVRKASGAKSVADLNGASVCLAQGTTTELNIADYFRSRGMTYKIVTFNEPDEARDAYGQGRCDAWSNDRSNLAARGLGLRNRDEHVILPDTISKEPIGPMVRQGDPQWAHVVRWVYFAVIAAEELGVTAANAEQMRRGGEHPEVRRLLGTTDDLGQKIGLSGDWAYNAIRQVGNYGEIFDRHLGPDTRLGLARGQNALWKHGGLLMAPPFR
jgi:general L-amino acid transport system substrate-binding protein